MNNKTRLTVKYVGNVVGSTKREVGFIDIYDKDYVNLYFLCKDLWNYEWFNNEVLIELIKRDVIFNENHYGEYDFEFRESFNVKNLITLMKRKEYKFYKWSLSEKS